MAETLTKLRPDRDLLCYFLRPSAIAALSATSQTGFTVSGSWRQQFDWAVIEWNRDNTFEHPSLRNLPDGDLSGITLSYEETRDSCIPLDSNLYPTVDWPYLRLWVDTLAGDQFHRVRLADYAIPVAGTYSPATAIFTLTGTPTPGDYVEIAVDPFGTEHYNYQVRTGDTPQTIISALAAIVNSFTTSAVSAAASGPQLTLTFKSSARGMNANRVGAYGSVSGSRSVSWQPEYQTFSGGTSPTRWRVTLPFDNLVDADTQKLVPVTNVRKMRWTYAADLQSASFTRCEFAVVVSAWTVTGGNLPYLVAGPGSRRIEDSSSDVVFSGSWQKTAGNFSGGTISVATEAGVSATVHYTTPLSHQLFIGTRRAPNASSVTVTVDGQIAVSRSLQVAAEDVLVRLPVGNFGPGGHLVTITHSGPSGTYLYFDFCEIAVPTIGLPSFAVDNRTTLATDWDTDHSISLAPERTAWLIGKLGYLGRANHYVGALWFFELLRAGTQYASCTITLNGTAQPNAITTLTISGTDFAHLHLIGDTTADVAKALELQVNNGSTGVWARAAGDTITITARAMGSEGNAIPISASTTQSPASGYSLGVPGSTLAGGIDGTPSGIGFQDSADGGFLGWRTDLSAIPRVNRAARDWCRSFYEALGSYGISATAAFSTELQFGDPSTTAAIAQRYPDGAPVELNTPAIQTNFSDVSAAFWERVYLDMAVVMQEAGQKAYLQFGEVQWWYFSNGAGLPFYDAFTTQQYQSIFGSPLPVIGPNSDPRALPNEAAFLSGLLGRYTNRIMQFVRTSVPDSVFEVLYPLDVNSTAINSAVNFATKDWTPTNLACLKTESFGFTGGRDLNQARHSILFPLQTGFPRQQSSHLVGISDPTTPWSRETDLALGEGVESVVLFALDQYCLVGYTPRARARRRRSFYTV